jgi:DegV family protein with EDD domain
MVAQWGIRVVPMRIRIDDRLDEETRVPRVALLDALRAHRAVSTEPPESAAIYWTYKQAVSDGADAIVSIHISSRQSKTYNHAIQAASHIDVPVHVVDSGTLGMSLGYAVTAAARVAAAGGNPQRVLTAQSRRLTGSVELFYVDTLEYLHRGGRIGGAAKLFGGALSLKPLLTIQNGEVAPFDKSLGRERALRKLITSAVSRAQGRGVDVAIGHIGAPDQAHALLDELKPRIPQAREVVVAEASSGIAVHLGPGALSITVSST